MRTVAFCEIEPYCRAVLRKHWPDVTVCEDIRTISCHALRRGGVWPIDVICGGFPCQDISLAGQGVGIEGARSGLWKEYARLIGEIRPRYVIVENVAALLGRGLSTVLGDLAALGFDAEWHCIPAAYVGARHIRDRVWIIANPTSQRQHEGAILHIDAIERYRESCKAWGAHRFLLGVNDGEVWTPPDDWDDGMADGIPEELDMYGNAVVPQIAEIIGNAIMQAEGLTV